MIVEVVDMEVQKATKDDRKYLYIKENFYQESVTAYKNDTSHKTWFMNDLGGYYFYQTEGLFGLAYRS